MKSNASSQPTVIRIEDATADNTSTHWFVAIFLFVAAGLIVWYCQLQWNFNPDSRDFNPIVIAPLVLRAIGLRFLVPAVLGTLRGRRFGCSVLEIKGPAVRMGTAMCGRVITTTAIHPQVDYEVSLRCIETFAVRSTNDSSSITRNIEHIRWESIVRVPATVNPTEGIPFEIVLPDAFEPVPETNPESPLIVRGVVSLNLPGGRKIIAHNEKPLSTHWVLLIKGALQGVDYHAQFAVPVEPPASPEARKRQRR